MKNTWCQHWQLCINCENWKGTFSNKMTDACCILDPTQGMYEITLHEHIKPNNFRPLFATKSDLESSKNYGQNQKYFECKIICLLSGDFNGKHNHVNFKTIDRSIYQCIRLLFWVAGLSGELPLRIPSSYGQPCSRTALIGPWRAGWCRTWTGAPTCLGTGVRTSLDSQTSRPHLPQKTDFSSVSLVHWTI